MNDLRLFPRNIFQVWFQGCDQLKDPDLIENTKKWKLLNPLWSYYCVNDNDLRSACQNYSDKCRQIYDGLPFMHMKIDLGRYILVYLNGGIYTDIDMYILKTLETSNIVNSLIEKYEKEDKNVLAISKKETTYLERLAAFFDFGDVYNNAMMISSPLNPILKLYIDAVLKACEPYINYDYKKGDSYRIIQSTTGPKFFSKFFRNYNHKQSKDTNDELIILPQSVFEPCDFGNECHLTKDTIALHQYQGSWLSNFNKNFTIFYYNYLKKNLLTIIIILIASIIIYKLVIKMKTDCVCK